MPFRFTGAVLLVRILDALVLSGLLALSGFSASSGPAGEALSLRETVASSVFYDLRSGPVRISGFAPDGDLPVRVTTSSGASSTTKVARASGKFACRYPDDFGGAGKLVPGLLFIDATSGIDFNAAPPDHIQAGVAVIVHGGRDGRP